MLIGIPFVAFAALPSVLVTLLTTLQTILTNIVGLVIGLAFVVFLWGVFKYVTAGGADDKKSATNIMVYGIVGLFIMLAAWGLVNLLLNTFGLTNTAPLKTTLPKIKL